MNELTESTRDRLADASTALWWPGLARRLVDEYCRAQGVHLQSYSTTTCLTHGAVSPERLLEVQSERRVGLQTVVEIPAEVIRSQYQCERWRFYSVDDLAGGAPLEKLAKALDEIAAVPDLADAIGVLALRVHLLVPGDDAYDVNFSEPRLPFSIFVSVPQQPVERMEWRLAEAIVHEASHLQLSLVEHIVPLVASPTALHFSPWRNTVRPVGGVLHGLYVFGVVSEWLARSAAPTDYIRQRRAEIAREVEQIAQFAQTNGLTDAGAALARNVLARISPALQVRIATPPARSIL